MGDAGWGRLGPIKVAIRYGMTTSSIKAIEGKGGIKRDGFLEMVI